MSDLQNCRTEELKYKPELARDLKTELSLLYEILGEDIPEEYWEQIEEEI